MDLETGRRFVATSELVCAVYQERKNGRTYGFVAYVFLTLSANHEIPYIWE
jgi:hypothetical protein